MYSGGTVLFFFALGCVFGAIAHKFYQDEEDGGNPPYA